MLKIFYRSKKVSSKSVGESYSENLLNEAEYFNNETRVQENLSFDKISRQSDKKVIKYKLPSLEFMKNPSKKD